MTKLASIEFEFEYDDDLSDDEIREQFFDDLFNETTGPDSEDIQPNISEKRPDAAIPNDTIIAICKIPIVLRKTATVRETIDECHSGLDQETMAEIGDKQIQHLDSETIQLVAEHLFYEEFWNSKYGINIEEIELEFSR